MSSAASALVRISGATSVAWNSFASRSTRPRPGQHGDRRHLGLSAALTRQALRDAELDARVVLHSSRGRTDHDHVGDLAQRGEHRTVTVAAQVAGLAVAGRTAVDRGDHVAPHPARPQLVGIRVALGEPARIDLVDPAQHCELRPVTLGGHTQNHNTPLRCLHARVQRCRASGRSTSQRHPGAADRSADPAAHVRRRQLRHLHARSGGAVAGRGDAGVPAVLRAGGAAAGRQEEAVRQARRAARGGGVPRRRIRCRQDAPAGVVVLRGRRGLPVQASVRHLR